MKIFKTRSDLSSFLAQFHQSKQSVGFVPTMGALHQGHLSLIQLAKEKSDIVVCSIFVNPTQFNDPNDLKKYPRPLAADIQLLEQAGCDVLFVPEVSEIYDTNTPEWTINLDGLDERLEGKIRPGHYQGVTQVVKILFDIVAPNFAFFGQKDYQQLLVIKKMIDKLAIATELIMCPTVRESDGLAMSSRNIHLSPDERSHSIALSRALKLAEQEFKHLSIQEITDHVTRYLQASPGIELEYFQLCNGLTLEPIADKQSSSIVALIAARLGKTRLIDNIVLK